MKVWISTVGWSNFAVINPVWAACFGGDFIPEKVILLNNSKENKTIEGNLAFVKDYITRVLTEYGVENPIIEGVDASEDDIDAYTKNFRRTVKEYRGDEVAIDMTPGRKFMSSIAMAVAMNNLKFVKRLYYLQLWGREYQNLPFIKIPFKNQRLINVLKFL